MKELPANLIIEKNKLQTDSSWIILIQINLNDGLSTIKRYARNHEDITYGGETYTAAPFDLEPIGQNSDGVLSTMNLKISNVSQMLESFLNDNNGLIESTVLLTFVNTGNLTEDYAELELTYDVVGCTTTAKMITFKLGVPSLTNQSLPLYKYKAQHCRWDFKSAECKYAGGESTCNRTLTRCRALSNSANFGGFLGLKSGGYKIA